MKCIGTQVEMFDWLGDAAKNSGPSIPVSSAVIDQFDDMIEQIGRTGSWVYDGSLTNYINRLGRGLGGRRKDGIFSIAALSFMVSVPASGTDKGLPNQLRVNSPSALSGLLGIVGEVREFLFMDVGYTIQCSSSFAFADRHGFKVACELENIKSSRDAFAAFFGEQYVVYEDIARLADEMEAQNPTY